MLGKNEKIRQSLAKTREKRKSQVCRTFSVKIQFSKLNKLQREQLKMIPVEAKWFANHILNWAEYRHNNIFDFEYFKCKSVLVKNKDGIFEERKLNYLPSSIKQSIHKQMCSNIKSISTLKKKGLQDNVGKLKFKSEYKAINYKNYGYGGTHRIKGNNRIKLQGIKKPLLVNGLNQFIHIEGIEFANFILRVTPNGYYIDIVTYTPKENIIKEDSHLEPIGIDFGCQDSFIFSTGEKVNVRIEESERMKRYQRKAARQKRGSNNYIKTRKIIGKEYQRLVNKRNDAANKLVSKLKKHKLIVIQDEQLQKWAKNKHGKAISHSILGRVKAKLKELPQTVILDKMIPTTKLCTKCGNTYDISLYDRKFVCPHCGEVHDRDIHAAENMLWIAQTLFNSSILLGQKDFKRVEFLEELSKHFNSAESHRTEKHEANV